MLVLTRKKNQGVMLGDDIKVIILEIMEDGVKIGIDAPKNLLILRSELYQAVRDENITALSNTGTAADLLKSFFGK
jgi:carbon storage regulator